MNAENNTSITLACDTAGNVYLAIGERIRNITNDILYKPSTAARDLSEALNGDADFDSWEWPDADAQKNMWDEVNHPASDTYDRADIIAMLADTKESDDGVVHLDGRPIADSCLQTLINLIHTL